MIPFNVPPYVGNESEYIAKAIGNHKICGDGEFTKKCSLWMEEHFKVKKVLLTTSCTSALEMAALLCNVKEGDEVILPSYTFCSTADAFVQRGAKLVFVDVQAHLLLNALLYVSKLTSQQATVDKWFIALINIDSTVETLNKPYLLLLGQILDE